MADKSAGFEGACDDDGFWGIFKIGGGCSGTIPDAGKGFADIQGDTKRAASITDQQTALDAIRSMSDNLDIAESRSDSNVKEMASGAIADARSAIADATLQVAGFGDWSTFLSDASMKTDIALNMLNAGKTQLTFAADKLKSNLGQLGIDFSMVGIIIATVIGGIILWRITRK